MIPLVFNKKKRHAEVANQLSGSGFPKITNFAAHRSQILTIGLQLLCDISLLKTKKIIWLMGSPQDAVKFNTLRSNCCCKKHKLIEIIVFSPNQCCKYKTTKNQRSRCASNYKKTKLFWSVLIDWLASLFNICLISLWFDGFRFFSPCLFQFVVRFSDFRNTNCFSWNSLKFNDLFLVFSFLFFFSVFYNLGILFCFS